VRTQPEKPVKARSKILAPKPPVATSAPVRTTASKALRGAPLTVKEARRLSGSEERHIEPRRRPQGEPVSPRTSARIEREGGIGLAKPARLIPKQRQSLGGSVMAYIEPRGSAKSTGKRSPVKRSPLR
jgi:hypothetical protein